MREEIATQKNSSEAPGHGSDQKQNEESMSPLPGTAANGGDKQRDISNYGD